MQALNTAFMAKLGWKILTEKDKLWDRAPPIHGGELPLLDQYSNKVFESELVAAASFCSGGMYGW